MMFPWLDRITQLARHVIAGRDIGHPDDWGEDGIVQGFHDCAFPCTWAHATMPKVAMGHKMCASLMATTVPLDQDLVIPPWSAFVLTLPTNLIPVPAAFLEHTSEPFFSHVFVGSDTDAGIRRWTWLAVAGIGQLHRHLVTTESLVEHTAVCTFTTGDLRGEHPLDGEADRLMQAIGRLIAGTCLRLSNQDTRRPDSGGGKSKRTIGEPPMPWTIQVTGDVRVDCREAVVDYIRGGGKSPTVQCLVRGHWKRQHFGVGRIDRKWVHVEPYWRGPEDAPVAVRRHVLQQSA